MSASKYKKPSWKKQNRESHQSVCNLRKENAYLKKCLVELSHQHSGLYKLLEKFLSLETERLSSSQHLAAKGGRTDLPPEDLSQNEGKPVDVDCTSNEQLSTSEVAELQNHLRHALEKNQKWLEYDQQREAYVRAILVRMLRLETQLNEANQAQSQQHNKDHSADEDKISQMKEHHEMILQKAQIKLELVREQVDMTHQDLVKTQNRCKEKEKELDDFKQQLLVNYRLSKNEEQKLRDKTEDLQGRLQRCKLAKFQVQANAFVQLKHRHADQEKIADLERQVKIYLQDLEDKKEDCSYLKKQMVEILKKLNKSAKAQSKVDQEPPGNNLEPPTSSNFLNESFLECPGCKDEYPASHYRELMDHMETCLDSDEPQTN